MRAKAKKVEIDALRRALEPTEKAAARERQGTRNDKHPGNFPRGSEERARDKIGAFAGVSGRTVDDAVVTAAELGALIGVISRKVRFLRDEGHVVPVGRGRFLRDASVRKYCEHLRKVAARHAEGAAGASLTAERTRLAREQANRRRVEKSGPGRLSA